MIGCEDKDYVMLLFATISAISISYSKVVSCGAHPQSLQLFLRTLHASAFHNVSMLVALS